MTKKFQRLLQISLFAIMGSLLLINCESDADNLGAQFFQPGAAQDGVVLKDLTAYNISHNDTVRTDGYSINGVKQLDSVTIGAFNVPQFGVQKSAYVTQVRLSSYAPDFGTNAVTDSAVITIRPQYSQVVDSVKTTTNTSFNYPDGNIASTRVVNTYPVLYKYGRTKIGGKTSLTINVNEITDFLGAPTTSIFSNQNYAEGALIGSKTFNGDITSVNIKKNSDNVVLVDRPASLRIPLDAAFFQSKIIAKNGMSELSDVSTFIRYFKGLKISVAENDGFLFKFKPSDITLQLYYKNDVVTNGVTTRQQFNINFDLGSSNVRYEKISYDRTATAVQSALAISNPLLGDAKLYPQGMGGPGIGLKIPDLSIVTLRNLYNDQKAGILSAKIRLYSDPSWTNKFKKPFSFTAQQKDVGTFLKEFTSYVGNASFNFISVKDLYTNPSYYDVDVTKTVKDIIETGASNKDFVFNVGSYTVDSATNQVIGLSPTLYPQYLPYGQNFTTRYYTPNAVVLVGSDPTSDKRAQLRIVYSSKQ